MLDTKAFYLPEEIRNQDYLLATYYMRLPKGEDVIRRAVKFANGQTLGTWVEVPGITSEMCERYMGRVVRIYDAPPCDLSTQRLDPFVDYFVQLAFPRVNVGAGFPGMLTMLLGNDASTSSQAKLVDLQFSDAALDSFAGPRFGIEGLRKATGVYDRPLVLSMIKPCTGLTPEQGAEIFYKVACGGADIVKDDELLGSTEFSRPADRVRAFAKAGEAAYQQTGSRTIYAVNITDTASRLMDNLSAVLDAGAKAVMINVAAIGYSQAQQVAESCPVPLLGHYAGAGMFYEGVVSGMSSPLAVGRLPRLCGVDMQVINTPYGGYPLEHQKYLQQVHELTLPLRGIKPCMPIIGGGVHPGVVWRYTEEVGIDMILGTGGAIHGHPQGAEAGTRAMIAAARCAAAGISPEEAAAQSPELRAAFAAFGAPQ